MTAATSQALADSLAVPPWLRLARLLEIKMKAPDVVVIGFLTPGTGLLYCGLEPSEAGSCPAYARSDETKF
jgi:hypothetical protein